MSPWLLTLALLAQSPDAGTDEVVDVDVDVDAAKAQSQGYTPTESPTHETLRVTGYVDVGFAKAFGDGSSFAANDTRVPADYLADAFAPAVNSRGEVASTDTRGRFTNGFLPRSVGIGARPSFLLNTASVDVRFTPKDWPVFVFARLQAMPRLEATGDRTRVELQQAFGRFNPLKEHELFITVGRFDSVFGIEYLENEANLRPGVTPSLIARYTTGQSLGVKALYRAQVPALWSAFSVNAAVTNSGTRIEALVPVDASLVGVPVASARLGWELNTPKVQAKLGVSGLYGPRNDQRGFDARQLAVAADLRVYFFFGLSLAGEFLRLVDEQVKAAGKLTGQGPAELGSAFDVWGGWARLAWTAPWKTDALTGVTVYARYDRRLGRFEGFPQLVTDRLTVGARVDLFDLVALKVEGLFNREVSGAVPVDNDVFTSSVVFTW